MIVAGHADVGSKCERAAQERIMYAAQLVESVDVKERKLVLGRKGKEENRKWMEGSKAGCWDWWVGLASLLTSMLPSTVVPRTIHVSTRRVLSQQLLPFTV